MGAARVNGTGAKLKRFIDRRAEEEIIDERKAKIMDSISEKIRAGDFDNLRRKEDKRTILRYVTAYLAEQTSSGKIKIIVVLK